MSKLREIFDTKHQEVAEAKAKTSLQDLKAACRNLPPIRPFRKALIDAAVDVALIAEVKKASPSQGMIRADFDPAAVARSYERAGAQCLSVLTDVQYFAGSPDNLRLVRDAVVLPLLRKDFIDDPYQLYEARLWGADAILLIVAGLLPSQLRELNEEARTIGLDVLVEVHDEDEVETANDLNADLVGVNNRNLSTFETNLSTSEALIPLIHGGAVKVSESALRTYEDIQRAQEAGAHAVLIGTTFCAAPDVEAKVREVMNW